MNDYPLFETKYIHTAENPTQCYGELWHNGEKLGDTKEAYYCNSPSSLDNWASNLAHHTVKCSASCWKREHVWLGDKPNPKDFKLEREYYQWSCGDGCCSDSGYQGRLEYKGEYAAKWSEWRYCSDENNFYYKVQEWLDAHFGEDVVKVEDIPTHKFATDEGTEYDEEQGYTPRIEYEDY